MKKKWPLLILFAVLLAGIAGNSVYAWLIDRKEAENRMGFTQNRIHIEEEFDPPGEVEPGQVIVKKPCMVNDSGIPVYVRARIVFTNSEGRKQCEELLTDSGWRLQSDGYYYYQKELKPGEKTSCIFERVVVKSTVKKEELVPFEILVYGESVQRNGFDTAEAAFEALREAE